MLVLVEIIKVLEPLFPGSVAISNLFGRKLNLLYCRAKIRIDD